MKAIDTSFRRPDDRFDEAEVGRLGFGLGRRGTG